MDGYVDLKTRLKGMNRKEKVEHIWEYYRLPIIATIIAIIVIVSTAMQIAGNKKSVLTVISYGGYVDTQKTEDFGQKVKKTALKDTNSKEKVEIQSMMLSTSDQQVQSAEIQKFMAMIASGDIDIVMMSKDQFETYANQRLFHKIDDNFTKQLNISGSKLLKYKYKKDKAKFTYGIDISGNKKLNSIKFDNKDKFIGIVSTASHVKNAKAFIRWMLQ